MCWWWGWGWSRILFHRKIYVIVLISYTTVSHSFYAFLVRSSVLTVTCSEVDRSTTRVERTSTDTCTYRIPTGCLTRENRTNRILTHKKRTYTEHIYPVASVRSFEHIQNLPTDTCKTGQNGYYPTRNDFIA